MAIVKLCQLEKKGASPSLEMEKLLSKVAQLEEQLNKLKENGVQINEASSESPKKKSQKSPEKDSKLLLGKYMKF